MPAYIHLVRDHGPNLLIAYPNKRLAARALDNSDFIDGLIHEDCIDEEIITDPARLTEVQTTQETETIIPPECTSPIDLAATA